MIQNETRTTIRQATKPEFRTILFTVDLPKKEAGNAESY
jgi:hypothetical protein